jgi:hypothetical protein
MDAKHNRLHQRNGKPPAPPPAQSLEAEKGLLGGILLDNKTIDEVVGTLNPDHFYLEKHQRIFRAILRLRDAGIHAFDPITVRDALEKQNELDESGGDDYLIELLESVPHAGHCRYYAECIRGAAFKRRLQYKASDLQRMLQDPSVELDDAIDFADGLTAHIPRGGPSRCTARELQNRHPHLSPPVIDGLAREAETVNVISVSKVGKSWFAYCLLLSVATGRIWLDKFGTAAGRVLLVDNELQPATLAHRIATVADAMGISRDEYADDLEIMPLRGKGADIFAICRELDRVPAGAFKLIVIDAKYRAMPNGNSENDNATETAFYNEVDRCAERLRAAFVLIHHASKGNQAEKRVTDVGAGAGAQSRAADCHLILREHDDADAVVLDAAVRSFPPVEPMGLRWVFPLWIPDETLDPGGLKGKATADPTADSYSAEVELAGDKGTILAAMADLATAETKTGIRDRSGLSGPRFARALGALLTAGSVVAVEKTKGNNRKYTGFVLAACNGQHPSASVNDGLTGASESHPSETPLFLQNKGGLSDCCDFPDALAAPVSLTGAISDGCTDDCESVDGA